MEIFKKASKSRSRKLLIAVCFSVVGVLALLFIIFYNRHTKACSSIKGNLNSSIAPTNNSAIAEEVIANGKSHSEPSFIRLPSHSKEQNNEAEVNENNVRTDNVQHPDVPHEREGQVNAMAQSLIRSQTLQEEIDKQNDAELAERLKDVVCAVCQTEKAVTFPVCGADDRHRCCYECFEELRRSFENDISIQRRCPVCRQQLHASLRLRDNQQDISANSMANLMRFLELHGRMARAEPG